MSASLKRADVKPGHPVTCVRCEIFVQVVGGIRGTAWEREKRLRHFYTVAGSGRLRKSSSGLRFVVTPFFFNGVYRACEHFLIDHLEKIDSPQCGALEHVRTQALLPWIAELVRSVDFDQPMGKDVVVRFCAKLLDISPQQVYAQLGS